MSLPLAIGVVLLVPAVLAIFVAACMAPFWVLPFGGVVALIGALMGIATSLAYGDPSEWSNIVLGSGMVIMLFGLVRVLTEDNL